MANFRSLDSIVLSMLDYIRIVQPGADTKPGTVFRDVSVDAPAQEVASAYSELQGISNLQSMALASGSSIDRLASNFRKRRGTGSTARGIAVLTFASIDSDLIIPANTSIAAKNGVKFKTINTVNISAANLGIYAANALRLREELDNIDVTDQYAVEVAIEAISPGLAGNIGKYFLTNIGVSGVSNVTNLNTFTGGANAESDAAFRSRALSAFAGASLGTVLGYINLLRSDQRIVDILAVEPGDPLMTRDGTTVGKTQDGELVVVNPGIGGKVDLYIQGDSPETVIESYIYKDLSGVGDPTNPRNDYTLGQRGFDKTLNFQQLRRQAIQAGRLPFQPAQTVTSISGSLSGANFREGSAQADGTATGNFTIVKDEGDLGGSPFGFDRIKWISNNISLDEESVTKSLINGQDRVLFTGISGINSINQPTTIRNEAATIVGSDRSLLTLTHKPILAVDRVFNTTTGERYTVSNSNPNGSIGEPNLSGEIRISGNTLPTASDNVEVTYLWDHEFDNRIDYDNLVDEKRFRTVQDSVDWSHSNQVYNEELQVLHSSGDGYHVITQLPISGVTNALTFSSQITTNIAGKTTVSGSVGSVLDIKIDGTNTEVFNTRTRNGSFSGSEITLPTDTISNSGDALLVRYNITDIYSIDEDEPGTFTGNMIKLPSTLIIDVNTPVLVNYATSVISVLPNVAIEDLPAVASGSQFTIDSVNDGNQPVIRDGYDNIVRFAPTYLRFNVQGTPSRGRLTISGTTFQRIEDVIAVTSNGLSVDLQASIRTALGIQDISRVTLSEVVHVERVTPVSSNEFRSDQIFDLTNLQIHDTAYSFLDRISNTALPRSAFALSGTAINIANQLAVGQRVRVVYYVSRAGVSEPLIVGSPGFYISKYKYARVERVSISSGFRNSAGSISGSIIVTSINQPLTGTSYLASYSYTAPKEGERITIEYNFNKLVSDATFIVERNRPITADVLIKQAKPTPIDTTVRIITDPSFGGSAAVLVSVEEALNSFIAGFGLGEIIDASDIINACYQVAGVDRVIITKFNISGSDGVRKSLTSSRGEHFTQGRIIVQSDTR